MINRKIAHSWWAFSDRKRMSLILIFIYVYIILYYIYKYFTSLSIKCKINMSLQGILLSYFPGLLLHFPRNHVLTPYISTSRIISTFVSNGPAFLLKIIVIPKKGRQVRIRRVIRSTFVVQIKNLQVYLRYNNSVSLNISPACWILLSWDFIVQCKEIRRGFPGELRFVQEFMRRQPWSQI